MISLIIGALAPYGWIEEPDIVLMVQAHWKSDHSPGSYRQNTFQGCFHIISLFLAGGHNGPPALMPPTLVPSHPCTLLPLCPPILAPSCPCALPSLHPPALVDGRAQGQEGARMGGHKGRRVQAHLLLHPLTLATSCPWALPPLHPLTLVPSHPCTLLPWRTLRPMSNLVKLLLPDIWIFSLAFTVISWVLMMGIFGFLFQMAPKRKTKKVHRYNFTYYSLFK